MAYLSKPFHDMPKYLHVLDSEKAMTPLRSLRPFGIRPTVQYQGAASRTAG
jgi:hypothetical protein